MMHGFTHRSSRSGFAMAITMIMALVLAVVAASFLTVSTTVRRVTESHYNYHAMESALERGVDQAMYAFGLYRDGGYAAWPAGWTANGSGHSRTFTEVPLGNGRTVTLRVTIQNVPVNASALETPYIVAESAYDGTGFLGSRAYSRQVLAVLKRQAQAGPGNGLVVQNKLIFKGNGTYIDSYTSSPNPITGLSYAYGVDLPGGGKNIGDQVTVASNAVVTTTFDPLAANSGGEIYGYALVGQVATGGLTDEQAAAKLKQAFGGVWVHGATSANKSGLDSSRAGTGYSATFPAAVAPDAIYETLVMAKKGATTIGSAGSSITRYYKAASFGGGELIVQGPVVLVLTGDLSMSGQDQITIDNSDKAAPASSLRLYVGGNVSVSGNGIINSGPGGVDSLMTSNLTLYGTNADKTKLQNIKISGNGAFSGTLYAPFASVELKGGGSSGAFYGSLTAYDVTINGGAYFHYDLALNASTSGPITYPVDNWVEPANKVAMSKYGL